MILFLKQYASKSSIKILTNTCPIVLIDSNKPRVTCFGFQLDPKKIMNKRNTSCALGHAQIKICDITTTII
jgi:hypothetical protein